MYDACYLKRIFGFFKSNVGFFSPEIFLFFRPIFKVKFSERSEERTSPKHLTPKLKRLIYKLH